MHVAQFVQRYPPALGGSEVYTARLCEYLAACGDTISVWTSSATELSEMWGRPAPLPKGKGELAHDASGTEHRPIECEDSVSPFPLGRGAGGVGSSRGDGGVGIHRSPPLHFPARRYVLKALSLLPFRHWQCFTTPCNPISLAMWRDAARYDGPLDAVHATAFPYSFPIACGLKLARRRGVPFLLTPFLHLGDPTDPHDRTRKQYTKPHLRWLLKQADRVFVQTRAEGDAAVSLGIKERKVVLQGLGVDARECTGGRREAARTNWGVANEMVVGHLTNNSAEKGTVDLLRAAEIAWARGQQLRVVLAGPEMPNFRAFWNTFGPKDRVTRLGTLTDEQKCDFFAGIDCFALPSRCDSFGLVLLEAWANGKPNLVYRAGGPAELIRHNVDGLQAACGNVLELAEHLGRLAADANLRRALGENGQSRIGTEFQWGDKLELVRETIREVVTK
ncbi:Alpha-D-kanosaminyltransferase [Gemmata sp. SH-PL17]|nr:Alpha-D-kanosaminyltransferase [Gemmata sp. SH-PL17]